MAIFTRPAREGGKSVNGFRIECMYQGKTDPAPIRIEGIVVSQRKIESKGNLLTVKTVDGFKSVYFEKCVDCHFYDPNPIVDTDDGYDAWKDNQLTTYGSLPKRRY